MVILVSPSRKGLRSNQTSEDSKAHDFLWVGFTCQTSRTNNKGDIETFNNVKISLCTSMVAAAAVANTKPKYLDILV